MTQRVQVGQIQVSSDLFEFINEQAIPGTGINPTEFWESFDALIHRLSPINRALLKKRDELQEQI